MKQIPVNHLERKFGETKYGIGRFIPVVIDSILLYLTEGFTKSSRYALGKLSVFFGFISIGFFGVAIYQKLSLSIFIHKNPIFLIGITMLFVCLQLLTTAIISFFLENKK